ncbi:MAG TPA: alpha/beta hydrolase-fold protein [Anaerolineae bacterium]
MALPFVLLITAVLLALLLVFIWRSRWRRARLLATIQVRTVGDFASENLGNRRSIHVFLPPGYDTDKERRYKVLYVNDGQEMEALRMRETLARLTVARRMEPIIVVAIPSNEDRLHEYGTAVTANAQGLGTKAHAYARFVVEDLMPMINRKFRTLTGAPDTAILGASLGGLSAFDIAWNYPDLFGAVGVFSGSFWWGAGEEDESVTPNALIAHEMVRTAGYRPGFRAWFQAGTLDEAADRDQNGVIDAIQDTLELIDELEQLGYGRGRDIVYVEVRGGRHNYRTWASAFPDFLKWAFPEIR